MIRPKVDMIGRTFGRLTVVEQTEGKQKDRQAWYLCRCQCGKRIKARGTSLRRGQTASCGCLRVDMTRRRNKETAEEKVHMLGKRFHYLVVQERLETRRHGSCIWRCLCDCGNYHNVTTHNLNSGKVKSCGCMPTNHPVDLSGKKYGMLTVLSLTEERKSNGGAVWRCRCDCGNEVDVAGGNLNRGTTTSCGCIRIEDLRGQRFGRLAVAKLGQKSGHGHGAFWECVCDCGNRCQVQANKLKNGHTRSCGCLHNDTIKNITGERFGRLLVTGDSGKRRPGSGGVIWKCRCDCGQEREVRQDALLSGVTSSCGCLTSKGNEKVSRLLREANISYVREYSPPDLKGRKRFDFAVMEAGKVCYFIEYDGILHIKYSGSGWDTADRYQKTVMSDQIKNEYCHKKKIPIIRIPYTQFEALSLNDLVLEKSPYLLDTEFVR